MSAIPDIIPNESELGEGMTVTIGLWRCCFSMDGESVCEGWPMKNLLRSALLKIQSARAFITIACILSAFTTLCSLACAFIEGNSRKMLIKTVKLLSFTTLVGGIIGVAVGITFAMPDGRFQIAVASIISIVALVFNLLGAIATIIIP